MRAELMISGKVQKVSFRRFTKENSDRIGLKGWCKNLENGTVKAVIEGEKNKIEELIKLLRKGPEKAIVKNLEVKWSDKEEFYNFRIL